MTRYRQRILEAILRRSTEDHPVVVLTGARQTGKTTLLHHLFGKQNWRFIDLDDFDQLELAGQRPDELLAGSRRVVIDEAQREPRILMAVKQLVDRNRKATRIVISGSANLLLMKRVSETLAGRAVQLVLRPMTMAERIGKPQVGLLRMLLEENWQNLAGTSIAWTPLTPRRALSLTAQGALPPILDIKPRAIVPWWEGYVSTYLERDVLHQSPLASLPDFRRTFRAAALRIGQLLNHTSLARDVSVSAPTVRRYLDLLETTHLLTRLPAYAINRTKRLIKSPKLYMADCGLAAFLAGDFDAESVWGSPLRGAYLEQLVLQELLAEAALLTPTAGLYYWRTTDNYEVDFVVEWGRRLLGIEVKSTTRPHFSDARGLRVFLDEYGDRALGGVLLHMGKEIRILGKKIMALPISAFWNA